MCVYKIWFIYKRTKSANCLRYELSLTAYELHKGAIVLFSTLYCPAGRAFFCETKETKTRWISISPAPLKTMQGLRPRNPHVQRKVAALLGATDKCGWFHSAFWEQFFAWKMRGCGRRRHPFPILPVARRRLEHKYLCECSVPKKSGFDAKR